jgi:putative tryptophan/tyrosine transport system substrate-binding protein
VIGRREFITLLSGAAAWPVAARAQHGQKLPTIGLLGPNSESVDRPLVTTITQRLSELGWGEGRSISIAYRSAEGDLERAGEIAAEFVRLNVDVIVTGGDLQVLAARRATAAIPIVMYASGDPVGNGLVETLARPGGNVTGLSLILSDTAGKRVELLREVVPTLRRLAISGYFANSTPQPERDAAQAAARTLGLDVVMSGFARTEDVTATIESLKGRADALYVCVDPLVNAMRANINAVALAAQLPVLHSFRENLEGGGLISYGVERPDMFRRAAELVDKILRGAKPSDIPVEQPTRFRLTINLKTAKAIGLAIPESFLLRADEVIE